MWKTPKNTTGIQESWSNLKDTPGGVMEFNTASKGKMQGKKKLPKWVKSLKIKKVLSCKRKMGRKPISSMASDKPCRQEITPEKKHREAMLPKWEYRKLL